GFDIAEVERFRARHGSDGPRRAAVGGSSEGPFRAADPSHFCTHGTKTTKVRIRTDDLLLPLGISNGIAKYEKQRWKVEIFHGSIYNFLAEESPCDGYKPSPGL